MLTKIVILTERAASASLTHGAAFPMMKLRTQPTTEAQGPGEIH